MSEEAELVLEETKEGMQKSIEGLQRELSKIRTGRANTAILDGIMVDYHGVPTPLKSLASINAPEVRLLTVQPFDPSAIEEIERAIFKEDIGLSPVNDGKILRLPVPELTEERRKGLVKQVKKVGEEHKLGIRHARRDGIAMLKDLQKDGDLSVDESRSAQAKIQEVHDAFIAKIDQGISAKEKEVLQI